MLLKLLMEYTGRCIDRDLRDYHGYSLDGTTYNCYLVFGEDKAALIDNVYPGTSAQLWGRVKDAFQQEGREFKIDAIIQNHIEKRSQWFHFLNLLKNSRMLKFIVHRWL